MATAQVMIHAHCYQPPREEPWLELVPREPSAAPDHDWNSRITRECYRPLSRARVLDARNRILRVHNAWEWLSFNVGPTLVHWLERNAPDVLDAMRAGDRAAISRTGHGTAIAHPYHHVILPLASRRDKRTEVRWGVREFQRIFGRDPLAMWLPETGIDNETLEVVAAEGIRGVIVAPHQVAAPPADGLPRPWRQGRDTVWLLAYDGALAHAVAFGDLLNDSARFAARLTAIADRPLTAIATDGETFGHHHAFGDLAIAGVIDRLSGGKPAQMVGFEAVIAAATDSREVESAKLVAPTSWSCPHGVERWRSNCGCRMDPTTTQAWRAPLRLGLEVLRSGLDAVVEREWPLSAGNRHELRDRAGPNQDGAGPIPAHARLLLEAERHALAMFTSCAWFFDDIARIEPRVVLNHAARALEFLPAVDAEALEAALLTALAEAHANSPADGTGATIWAEQIAPGRRAPAALAAAIGALHEFAPHHEDSPPLPAHDWRFEDSLVVTIHRSSGLVRRWHTSGVTFGVVATRVHVREESGAGWTGVIDAAEFPAPFRKQLFRLAAPVVHEACFGSRRGELAFPGDDPFALLRSALTAAWGRVGLDGIASASLVVHGVLDLWALTGVPLPDDIRSHACDTLDDTAPSPTRDRLAERFGLKITARP